MEEKKGTKTNKKNIIILVIIALISLGAGFFGGIEYQKTKKVTFARPGMTAGNSAKNGTTNKYGANGSIRPVSGEITSVDNGTITVKLQDGSSKIIVLSGTTKIEVTTTGSTSDLKRGDTVSVIGTTDTSGTVTAQNVFVGGGLMQGAGSPPETSGNGQPPQGN